MKIDELLAPGSRKITLTVISVIGIILLEKFGGGLSQQTQDFIRDALLIFTGGNVLSKAIFATKEVKVAKHHAPIIEEGPMPPEDSAPQAEKMPIQDQIDRIVSYINNLDKLAGERLNKLDSEVGNIQNNLVQKEEDPALRQELEELKGRMDVQVQNVDKLIAHVQKLGAAVNGQPQTQQYGAPRL